MFNGKRNSVNRYTNSLLNGGQAEDERNDLFEIVDGLHNRLTPVVPRPSFITGLKAELLAAHPQVMSSYDERHEKAIRMFDRVVSVVAVTAIVSHILGSIVVLVTYVVQRGKRDTAAA